ncbi:MAG: transglycosylase SLT domain-containing protein [Fibrobacterota bacterium]
MFRIIISTFILFTSLSAFSPDSLPACRGNSELRAGNYAAAESLFTAGEYDDSLYYYLKMGELHRRQNDLSRAKYWFSKVLGQTSIYRSYGFRRIADIELELGHMEEALISYRQAAHSTDIKPYRFFLYRRIDSLARDYEDRFGSISWIVRWHRMVYGDTSAEPAVEKKNWEKRIDTAGLTEKTYNSYEQTARAEASLTAFRRAIADTSCIAPSLPTPKIFSIARNLSNSGMHRSASDWLHAALKRPDFAQAVKQKEYLYFRAELNYFLENWSNQIRWGKKYYNTYGASSQILYHLARSYRKLGNSSQADRWYKKHIDHYPSSSLSHTILWYRAWQKEDSHQYRQAIDLFAQIRDKSPQRKYGDDAAFRVGILHYRLGEYDKAIEEMHTFCTGFSRSRLFPGGYYWLGRSFRELGREDSAKVYFKKTIETEGLHYYAWRSRQALGKESMQEDLFYTDSALWDSVISPPGPDTQYDYTNRFMTAVKLGTIGFIDEAGFIIEPILLQGSDNFSLLLDLNTLYNSMNLHHEAYKISRKIYYRLPKKLRTSLPRSFLKRLYPQVYTPWVEDAAEKFSIDTFLVPAIMRQESMFSPTIRSYVGAVGLMQIMPYTGEKIAGDLNREFSREMLLDPETNLMFGAYYISKMLKRFDGNIVKAAASYNGGPHNVTKWVKRNEAIADQDPLFVEFIGFSETRNYVKKVLANLWTYRALYGNQAFE